MIIYKHHPFFILLFLSLIAFSCTSLPKQHSTLQEVRTEGILVVGMTGDYAPFSKWKSNHFEGIDVDLAEDLGRKLNVQVQYYKTSWPTLIDDLKDKKYHIAISGITIKPERQLQGYFSDGYVSIGKMGISRCADKDKFKSLKDIDKKGMRVAVNPGGTNESFARENIKKATIVEFPDNSKIFELIIQNKADIMMTDSIEVLYQANINKGKLCPSMEKPMTEKEIAIYMQKDAHLREFINQWLLDLSTSGRKKEIFEKHLK